MSAISELQAQRDAILFTHKWMNGDPVDGPDGSACLVYAWPALHESSPLLGISARRELFITLVQERPIELLAAAAMKTVRQWYLSEGEGSRSIQTDYAATLPMWNDEIATELAVLDLLDNTIRRLKGQGDVV